jgi:hypothetical protein
LLRNNWRSPAFWRYWWREGIRRDIKLLVILVLIPILLVGGYFAASGLTSAQASGGSSSYVLETTIQKVVTVREHGRVIVKRMPVVVRRTIVKNHTSRETIVDTRVVTTPGGVHYVTRKVLRYVPVVHKRVVTIKGKTTTITETRLVPTIKTQTQTLTNVVTNQQTVTNVVNHSETVVQPVTTVVVKTQTETQTLPPNTVTVTKTQTETQTETRTVTETVTQTQTVTEPSITITVGS